MGLATARALGSGGTGSHRLAAQFELGHNRGSSHGRSRIVRAVLSPGRRSGAAAGGRATRSGLSSRRSVAWRWWTSAERSTLGK